MVDNNIGNNLDRDHHHKYNFAGASSGSGGDQEYYGIIKEQDRLLPIANVGRIMKQILPPNAKISKEAKETMQECVSEFISFVTGEASDKCHKEKRKTVNGDDICWALSTLGFDNYSDQLKIYLHKYRELEGERASQNKAGGNTDHHHHHHQGKEEPTDGFNGEPPPQKHTLHPFKFNNMPDRSNSSTRF